MLALAAAFCLPMIGTALVVLTLAALNMSLGIRKCYVKILELVFEYATNIKKDKEIDIGPDVPTVKASSDDDDDRDELGETSMLPDTLSGDSIDDPRTDNGLDSSRRTSREHSQTDIQFRLGKRDDFKVHDHEVVFNQENFVRLDDIVDYTRQALEAIVDDEVTKRFSSADEMAVWNLLTRTQQHHELFSMRVTLLWFAGFLVRYFILFPFRLCGR